MEYIRQEIEDIILIQHKVFKDSRGFFLESYRKTSYAEDGISEDFVQDNQSSSIQGVLRGLHYQIQSPQGKLVQVIVGQIFDVAVDLRRNSPSFGHWVGTYLSAEKKDQLWIPTGFAHGYYTVSQWAEILYKTTNYYAPQWERTIFGNDPAVGIRCTLFDGKPPMLSPQDSAGSLLSQAELFE